jgi:hypothetical protein
MGRAFRFAQRVLFFAPALWLVTGTLFAQEPPATPDFSTLQQHGIPEDWSTQHVIYTQNGSVEDMMTVRGDPRFLNSFLLHSMRQRAGQNSQNANAEVNETALSETGSTQPSPNENVSDVNAQELQHLGPGHGPVFPPVKPSKNKHTKVDWAVSLGSSFGMAIGESPAKYSFNPTATPSCNDFVVFSLKAPPAVGGQANLVALKNLYSGTSPTGLCGTAPTFLFSYAIGSGGSLLSPVLSLNGQKVAWIENTTGGHAVLHVTTWLTGQGTNATTGAVGIGSGAAACISAGSCDIAIDYTSSAYSGCTASANTNTNSEIYVDYASDTAFVGADNGILYHLKGIFNGAPTFDFCINVNTSAGTGMSGGVYDPLLSPPELFIADSKKIYAYTVGATSYTLKATYTYGTGTITGPGPVLDAFNNFIYAFSASDAETPTHHTSVTQIPTSLAAGSGVAVPLGPVNTNAYPILFYGTFDNNYFTFGPKSAKSTLYSCGTDATTTTAQDLFAISFNPSTGIVNTTPAMPANKHVNPGGLNGTCSPITEFYDGTTDRIFVGIGEHLDATGANVVQMWNVTTQLTSTATTFSAEATNYLGGPSGLVIDNNASGTAQAESVYFTTLVTSGTSTTCGANNYCAVKLTQSLLQ